MLVRNYVATEVCTYVVILVHTSCTSESFQINVSYIRNAQILALVAPFIAATGASWPEKFGGNIKMV